jgi:Flp pilus assembly protein TadG
MVFGLRRHGLAAVELALVLPLLTMFLLGIWEVGRICEVQAILSNAAREGARQAATGQLTATQVGSIVTEYLAQEGVPTADVVVTVTNQGFPGNPSPPDNNPQDATDLDHLQVVVTIPFRDVRWINLPLVTNNNTLIYAQVTWSCMKDLAYTVPAPPPGY